MAQCFFDICFIFMKNCNVVVMFVWIVCDALLVVMALWCAVIGVNLDKYANGVVDERISLRVSFDGI